MRDMNHTRLLMGAAALALVLAAPAPALAETVEELVKKGTELGRQKQYAEAANIFELALKQDPGNVRALYAYGLALTRQGRLNDARAVVSRLEPSDPAKAAQLRGELEKLPAKETAIGSLTAGLRLAATDARQKACAARKKILLGAMEMYFMDHSDATLSGDIQATLLADGLLKERYTCPTDGQITVAFSDGIAKITCPHHPPLEMKLDTGNPMPGGQVPAAPTGMNPVAPKTLTPAPTTSAPEEEELIVMLSKGTMKLKDRRTGDIVVNGPEADSIGGVTVIRDGMCGFTREGLTGYFDLSGSEVIPPSFERGKPFSEGVAAVMKGRLWGFIDKTGAWKIEPGFVHADEFSEGKAFVKTNAKSGFIGPDGKFLFRVEADSAGPFRQNRCRITVGDKHAFIDEKGQIVVPPTFNRAGEFGEGLAPVKTENGLWGFIDPSGKMAVQPQFEDVCSSDRGVLLKTFSGGLIPVKKDGLWGYMNPAGELVIPCRFTTAHPFRNGAAEVLEGQNAFFIGPDGEEIVTPNRPSVPPPPPPR